MNEHPSEIPLPGAKWAAHSEASWKLAGLKAALILTFLSLSQCSRAQDCSRFPFGSVVSAPHEVRSTNGVLQLALFLRQSVESSGEVRYCYVDDGGNQSPTLRLKPGDLLILKLKNELPNGSASMDFAVRGHGSACTSHRMTAASTNLHFHGLMIPPICHQDDVIKTVISPGSAAFEYHVRIPLTQPPGLYWYHPHPHGHSEEQVLGGASGAIIIEGLEEFNDLVAGLPERLLVVRDQIRPNINFPSAGTPPPSKDLSINFIPVPYPEYPPAIIRMKPSQRELWRVVNASADTFLELHLLSNGKWQSMGLVALDGVPIGYENRNKDQVEWTLKIPLPPGGRAEFLFDGPAEGGHTQLLTAGVDTVPLVDEDDPAFAASGKSPPLADDDDFTPPRWLATVVAAPDAPAPAHILPDATKHRARRIVPSLLNVHANRTRKLYFSEDVRDPRNPRTSTIFYVTEEGHPRSAYNPAAAPNITVRQGQVEDWIIENRSQEAHTFHIHQTHFLVIERDGKITNETHLRDSVAVPYWDGVSSYPKIKLRIDFRDPALIGTFPYHCHILQHEDGGMMGTVQVLKSVAKK